MNKSTIFLRTIIISAFFFGGILTVICIYNSNLILMQNNTDWQEKTRAIESAGTPPSVLWNSTWGSNDTDTFNDIWSDGNYIYTVGTQYYLWYESDLVLVKWALNGSVIWNITWDFDGGFDDGFGIWGYGNYIYTVGSVENTSSTDWDLNLIKWDADGNIIWNVTWDENFNYEMGWDIWGCGTFIYTIGSKNDAGFASDVLLIKWDLDGNEIWNVSWGTPGIIEGRYSVWCDGSYIYGAGNTENQNGTFNSLLLKWDPTGLLIWNTTWYQDFDNELWGISSDGIDLYTTGYALNTSTNNPDVLLIKWSMDGALQWAQTLGFLNESGGYSLAVDTSGIYVAGYTAIAFPERRSLELKTSGFATTSIGSSIGGGPGDSDLLLASWDKNGSLLWDVIWGGPSYEDGIGIFMNGTDIYTCGSSSSYSAGGNDDGLLIKWYLDSNPLAAFTVNSTSIRVDDWVQCSFTGEYGDMPASFEWNFGDGSANATIENPTHQYTALGNYTITLTVTDNDGDPSTASLDIEVISDLMPVLMPVANFTVNATSIYAGEYIQCTFTGYEGDPPNTFQWDFGDGSANSSLQNPTHQYNTTGNFTITLTVIDADGDSSTTSRVISVESEALPPPPDDTTTNFQIPGFSIGILILGLIIAAIYLSISRIKENRKLE
ncbi:MAG: PKD domain-containing protein [Promethearchaeota archaeon]